MQVMTRFRHSTKVICRNTATPEYTVLFIGESISTEVFGFSDGLSSVLVIFALIKTMPVRLIAQPATWAGGRSSAIFQKTAELWPTDPSGNGQQTPCPRNIAVANQSPKKGPKQSVSFVAKTVVFCAAGCLGKSWNSGPM